ncbi:MAG: helix-turn-helix domain-containing protein [Candidatus Odinarchaeota archaeon]
MQARLDASDGKQDNNGLVYQALEKNGISTTEDIVKLLDIDYNTVYSVLTRLMTRTSLVSRFKVKQVGKGSPTNYWYSHAITDQQIIAWLEQRENEDFNRYKRRLEGFPAALIFRIANTMAEHSRPQFLMIIGLIHGEGEDSVLKSAKRLETWIAGFQNNSTE